MNIFAYPALFEKEEEGGYSVYFLDFSYAHTCGETLQDSIFMAMDCLGLVLYDLKIENKKLPRPSVLPAQPITSAPQIWENLNGDKTRFYMQIYIDLDEYIENTLCEK